MVRLYRLFDVLHMHVFHCDVLLVVTIQSELEIALLSASGPINIDVEDDVK